MGIILQPCRIVQCDPNKGSSSPARSLCEVTGPKDPTLETLTKKRKSRSLAYLPFKDTVQHFTLFHVLSFLSLQYGHLSPPSVFPESEKAKIFSSVTAVLLWALSPFWKPPRAHILAPPDFGQREGPRHPMLPPPRSVPSKGSIQKHPEPLRSVALFSLSWGTCLCPPENSPVGAVTPNVMALEGGVFGR